MNKFESRRHFSLGIAAFGGKLLLDQLAIPEAKQQITRSGTFTAYETNELMDGVAAYRFGFDRAYFLNPLVRQDISDISSLDELWSLQYWSQPLIKTPRYFEQMRKKLGDQVALEILQGICDESKPRPLLIAPDTFNFSPENPEKFIGSTATIETQFQLDDYGYLIRFSEPKSYLAYIIDVRHWEDHVNRESMLTDADPSTIASITNAHWDPELRWFRSTNQRVITRLPEVSLTIENI
jgi:hypothetical protein